MQQTLGSSSRDVLAEPVPGGHALTTAERRTVDHADRIPGWGSDLDPAVRPGVPRDKAPELGVEVLYPPIPEQAPPHLIHKSTEYPRLTPVFGTSCPPTGLSGRIRDVAYRFSEGRLAHWMMLMLADRVNVVEDVAGDLARGRVPNIPKEMGLATEWQHNRAGLVRKAAIAAIGVAVLVAWSRSRGRPSEGVGD